MKQLNVNVFHQIFGGKLIVCQNNLNGMSYFFGNDDQFSNCMLSQRAKILALVGNFTQQEIESMMLDIQPSYDKYNTGIICLPNVLIGSVIDECTV